VRHSACGGGFACGRKYSMGDETILIIDDNENMVRALTLYLSRAGYRVLSALSGIEGVKSFHQNRPDLVILDIMMPDLDGWEVCRRIRDVSNVPIIMLTAKGQEPDKVKGLRMGADDYVVKPFSMRELEARVRAVLRRSQLSQERWEGVLYSDDYLVIDAGRAEVRCGGKLINLTATEKRLLFLLARNRGRLLSTSQILTNIWGPEYIDEVDYVRLYIWRLRQKIEPVPDRPRYILTEHGMGYRFVGTQSR